MENLADALIAEQKRVSEILGYYIEAGAVAIPAKVMIENSLEKAIIATISPDVVAMIAAYKDSKEIN